MHSSFPYALGRFCAWGAFLPVAACITGAAWCWRQIDGLALGSFGAALRGVDPQALHDTRGDVIDPFHDVNSLRERGL